MDFHGLPSGGSYVVGYGNDWTNIWLKPVTTDVLDLVPQVPDLVAGRYRRVAEGVQEVQRGGDGVSATGRALTQRHPYDAYSTPTWCTEAIAREIVWGQCPTVLEPCVGERAIAEVIEWYVETNNGILYERDIKPEIELEVMSS